MVNGLHKIFIEIPFQQKFQILQERTRSRLLWGFGIKGDVEKSVNKENSTVHGEFLSNLLPVWEKTETIAL